MTKLRRPIKRTCEHAHYAGRPLVIIIAPTDTDDVVLVRQAGKRTAYRLPVLTIYYMAAKAFAAEQARIKREARKQRRRTPC